MKGCSGEDKRKGGIVYMDKVDEGMQWGRINGWDGQCTWIRRMKGCSGAGLAIKTDSVHG